ncbi:MAG: hypothetical protein BWY47_01443 [Bacteroidetes bacterium ADurb.Bin302]|nr:MAG: hypothetical protein BWY47_01443 [Bacteroidetes bacterium ADurb.Bin302]
MNSKDIIRDYIIEELMMGESAGINDQTSLRTTGMVDSTSMMDLVGFVEEKFNITISDNDVIPENFDSIAAIAALVERLTV